MTGEKNDDYSPYAKPLIVSQNSRFLKGIVGAAADRPVADDHMVKKTDFEQFGDVVKFTSQPLVSLARSRIA